HRVLPLRIISSFFFIFQLLYSSSFFPYTTLFRSCCTDHSCSCSQLACMSAVAGGAPWRTRAKSAKAVSALRAMRSVDGCQRTGLDRKSTRLNSSHVKNSYAVFCLKKKKKINEQSF